MDLDTGEWLDMYVPRVLGPNRSQNECDRCKLRACDEEFTRRNELHDELIKNYSIQEHFVCSDVPAQTPMTFSALAALLTLYGKLQFAQFWPNRGQDVQARLDRLGGRIFKTQQF